MASSPITGDNGKSGKAHLLNSCIPLTDNIAFSLNQKHLYSIFTLAQRRALKWQSSFSTVFLGLTPFIYYQAIPALSDSLHVSVAAIILQ